MCCYKHIVSGIFVPLQPIFAGPALLVHVCVLKCWTCKCFRKRRQHHHTAQDTFASEQPNTWRYTQGDIFSTRNPTEACIPNESEVDSPVVSQKDLLVSHGFNNCHAVTFTHTFMCKAHKSNDHPFSCCHSSYMYT